MVSSASLTGIDSKSFKKGDAAPNELQPRHFRLYSMRFCPFSERALIYLAKKGIKTEIVNINLKEKPEWYFEKNSDGTVPTLEYDGKVVIESTIIPQFLDDLIPESSILPKDPYERAQQRILFGQLSPIVDAWVGVFRATPEDRHIKCEKLRGVLAKAESLLRNKYFGGEHAGFADYMIYPFYERLALSAQPDAEIIQEIDFPNKEHYPQLTEWFQNMSSLPEVMVVQQPNKIMIQYLKGHVNGEADFDLGL